MIGAQLTGVDEAMDRLDYMIDHWEDLQVWVLKKMAIELREALEDNADFLHFVQVDDGQDVYYGVSLEPEPFQERLRTFQDRYLLFYTVSGDASDDLKKLADHGPWLADLIPEVPQEDEGFFFLRETAEDEKKLVRQRNLDFLRKMSMPDTGMDLDTVVWAQWDIGYNQLRGEYGIGDGRGKPVWRPALRRLVGKRLEEIFHEALELMLDGSLDVGSLPEFEDRSEEWLEEVAPFMLAVAPSS